MATKLRRVTVSLPADVDIALARVCEITGMAQSKFIVECLQQNVEMMNALCDAVEEFKNGDDKKSEALICEALGRLILKANS
ncbi:hypothetical protein QMU85_003899 [Photobacterium damselae]|nr:hypothetical protein [Photobacterium damselae]